MHDKPTQKYNEYLCTHYYFILLHFKTVILKHNTNLLTFIL
jgi:hypothetical protein